MSRAQDCSGCLWGDHERHDPQHGIVEGLLGGEYCACTGDCAERAQVRAESVSAWVGTLLSGTPRTVAMTPPPSSRSKDRQVLIDMLLPEVRQDCACLMFDKGPHRLGCPTMDRAENLADDILLILRTPNT